MNITTTIFRAAYVNVFKPRKNEQSGKEEYSMCLVFPKGADLKNLEAAAQKVMEEKWGTDKTKWPKPLRNPFRDQGDMAKVVDGKTILPAGFEAGAIFINVKTDRKPGIVHAYPDPKDKTKPAPLEKEEEFYAGCHARATVRAYAYDKNGNRGVGFSLVNIQKMRDDEPFASRMKATDEFAPIEGAAQSQDASSLFG